jgi:hypothetical protein
MSAGPDNSFDSDDLAWRAFCYVAGELSPVDAEQFEQLLADDLSACEAVASLTELSLSARTVLESQSVTAAHVAPDAPSRASRVLATVAAMASLVLLTFILSVPNRSDVPLAGNQERSRSELILSHWMSPIETPHENTTEEFESPAEDRLLVAYDSEGEVGPIPAWMFDAVRLEPHDAGPEIRDESGAPVREN